MRLQIQIECESPLEMASIAKALAEHRFIKPEDNPSAGLPPDPPAPVPAQTQAMASAGFGVGVTLPPGATPALSSAVAAPSSTAPAVPTASSAAPPAPPVPAAPPAPPAAAPTASAVPPAPAPAAGAELDKDGLPWDARIHAATKTKNKDGTWRQKRELDPAVRASVEAELKAALGVQAAAVAGAVPSAAPTIPAPAAAPAAPATWTFASFSEKLVPLTLSGQITQEKITEVLARHNLVNLTQLAIAPAAIPAIAADLGLQ